MKRNVSYFKKRNDSVSKPNYFVFNTKYFYALPVRGADLNWKSDNKIYEIFEIKLIKF